MYWSPCITVDIPYSGDHPGIPKEFAKFLMNDIPWIKMEVVFYSSPEVSNDICMFL